MNWKVSAFLAIACVTAPGCAARFAHQHPDAASEIRLHPQDITLTAPGEGKSCVKNILGIETSQPSYLDAQQKALQAASGELLLDEVSYDGMENSFGFVLPSLPPWPPVSFIFYGEHCSYVEGFGAKRK